MTTPTKISRRREELQRQRDGFDDMIAVHAARLEEAKHDLAVVEAEIAGIDLCVKAFEDAAGASAPVADAAVGARKPRTRKGATTAVGAAAGASAPRARRDIRSMTLDLLCAIGPHSISQAAKALGAAPLSVTRAMEYWSKRGRVKGYGDTWVAIEPPETSQAQLPPDPEAAPAMPEAAE